MMKTELLAPAGDVEAAYSAFYFGADAVYLGMKQFSARSEAVNFAPDELDAVTAYAHAIGKKVYVAVNTLVQEKETDELIGTLAACARCHADAIIVQDLGVARLVRRLLPQIPLHASTQMAVHNREGVRVLEKLGFARAVLARELSLAEIKDIQKGTDLELEVFIHGALCYSYSGLCLFSSLQTGRSANRGKCIYACRNLFQLDGKKYHPFSMKDLALEEEALKLPGISLKIEGRKKNALYVGAVTDYYRRILDTGKKEAGLADNLKQIFARPWTKLNWSKENKDVIEPDFIGHRGLPLGQAEKVFNHTLTLKIAHPIARYDGIQIEVPGTEKPFGFSAESLRVGGKPVFEAAARQRVELALPESHPFIPKGAAVYLSSSTRVKGAYPYTKPKPQAFKNRAPLQVDVFVAADKIVAIARGKAAEVAAELTPAKEASKTQEALRRAFEKTGEAPFELKELCVQNPDSLFVPASAANELRRRLYAQLDEAPVVLARSPTPLLKKEKSASRWIVKTDDIKAVSLIPPADYDELIIVLNEQLAPQDLEALPPDKVRLALPPVLRADHPLRKGIGAFLKAGYQRWEIGNIGALALLPGIKDITADGFVPVMNAQAAQQALELGISRVTFSPEDTRENVRALSEITSQTNLVVYQDAPLFMSAHPASGNGGSDSPLAQGKERFRLLTRPHETIVIKETPFYIAPEAAALAVGARQVDFCFRSYAPEKAAEIFARARAGKKIKDSFTGNFLRNFAA